MPGWGVKLVKDTVTPKLKRIRNRWPETVDDEVLDGGLDMVEYARQIVPVRTGFLRSTITFQHEGQGHFWFGATASYAKYVEFGTSRMIAQPYIRPALTRFLPDSVRNIAEALVKC